MRKQEELRILMEKVNDYWIAANPEPGDCDWERAAYFLGDLAAYEMIGKQSYLDYAVTWALSNHWNFHQNENHQATNADSLSCGEIYLDLMTRYGVEGDMEHIRKTLEWTVHDSANDYWWWIDTIYMALHFYTRMGLYLKEERLIDKAYRLYQNSRTERRCFDEEEGLWFRDERFLPEAALSENGKKIFWSRGNGWVLAGLARTLRTLPKEHPYHAEYLRDYLRMAGAIRDCQCGDGFWRANLLEPEAFPMPETSGTALNVLGLLIGIRDGFLEESFLDCALKGFEALTCESLEENGRIGWVQEPNIQPGPVNREATNDYAVGTYLLICRELIEYQELRT